MAKFVDRISRDERNLQSTRLLAKINRLPANKENKAQRDRLHQQLLELHDPFARWIAQRYVPSYSTQLNVGEWHMLYRSAQIGIWEAAEQFMRKNGALLGEVEDDSSLAVIKALKLPSFGAYMNNHMRWTISEYIAETWDWRMTSEMRGLVNEVRSAWADVAQAIGGTPTAQDIADALDLPVEKVQEAQHLLATRHAISWEGDEDTAIQEMYGYKDRRIDDVIEDAWLSALFRAMETSLSEREDLAVRRRLDGATFDVVGRDIGVTRERARQIIARAAKKLRTDHPGLFATYAGPAEHKGSKSQYVHQALPLLEAEDRTETPVAEESDSADYETLKPDRLGPAVVADTAQQVERGLPHAQQPRHEILPDSQANEAGSAGEQQDAVPGIGSESFGPGHSEAQRRALDLSASEIPARVVGEEEPSTARPSGSQWEPAPPPTSFFHSGERPAVPNRQSLPPASDRPVQPFVRDSSPWRPAAEPHMDRTASMFSSAPTSEPQAPPGEPAATTPSFREPTVPQDAPSRGPLSEEDLAWAAALDPVSLGQRIASKLGFRRRR